MDNPAGNVYPIDLDRLLMQAFADPTILRPILAESIEQAVLTMGKTPLRRKRRSIMGTRPTTTGGP